MIKQEQCRDVTKDADCQENSQVERSAPRGRQRGASEKYSSSHTSGRSKRRHYARNEVPRPHLKTVKSPVELGQYERRENHEPSRSDPARSPPTADEESYWHERRRD